MFFDLLAILLDCSTGTCEPFGYLVGAFLLWLYSWVAFLFALFGLARFFILLLLYFILVILFCFVLLFLVIYTGLLMDFLCQSVILIVAVVFLNSCLLWFHLFHIVFKSSTFSFKIICLAFQLNVSLKCFPILQRGLLRILRFTYLDKLSSTVSLMIFKPRISKLWFSIHSPFYVSIVWRLIFAYSIASPYMSTITLDLVSETMINCYSQTGYFIYVVHDFFKLFSVSALC